MASFKLITTEDTENTERERRILLRPLGLRRDREGANQELNMDRQDGQDLKKEGDIPILPPLKERMEIRE